MKRYRRAALATLVSAASVVGCTSAEPEATDFLERAGESAVLGELPLWMNDERVQGESVLIWLSFNPVMWPELQNALNGAEVRTVDVTTGGLSAVETLEADGATEDVEATVSVEGVRLSGPEGKLRLRPIMVNALTPQDDVILIQIGENPFGTPVISTPGVP